VYLSSYRPRPKSDWIRWTAPVGFLVVQVAFMELTGGLPVAWFLPCIAASALLMFAFVLSFGEVPARQAGYLTVRAFLLGELAASLEWQLASFARVPGGADLWWGAALLVGVYAVVFGSMSMLERRYRAGQKFTVTRRELGTAALLGVSVYAMSNLSYVAAQTPFTSPLAAEIFNIRTLVDFGGVVLLYAYHVHLRELSGKIEVNALQNLLETQYRQYQQSQQSIDLINQKYHDLKHQIAVVRTEYDPQKKNGFLNRLEEDIRSYEAQNKTGNQVLDTVLTSKSLYCQNNRIGLTCVADGAALDFVDSIDLCSVFGNALDNAIEAVGLIEASERRLIHLSISSQRRFVLTRIENCYTGELSFENGLPVTTKQDRRFHGFGMKSIVQTVAKYNGSVTVNTRKGWFELRILIPVPASE
jgi:hypothetical protein